MKKLHYLPVFGFLLLFACQKPKDTTCIANFSLQLNVADKQVNVFTNDYDPQDGSDMEYGPAGFTPGSGTTGSFTGSTTSFTVADYGTYDVYVRKKCSNGASASWIKGSINVDGSYTSCHIPDNLDVDGSSTYPRFTWYDYTGNFYDVEYGPSGFTLGNGTRLRTNDDYTYDAIMHSGVTYDFYVRSNCGGSSFSAWAGPHSYYASKDVNIAVPCTQPTNLYAYKTSATEINYTAQGHGSVSYEVSISTSNSTMTSNILSVSSPNGGVHNSGGYSGTHYCWLRGKCVNNTFTAWTISQVQ